MPEQATLNLITGTAAADLLRGTDAADDIRLGDGNDTADGGLGDDQLYGEIGNDSLAGGGGNDSLSGGIGDDQLDGGSGNDRLDGGAGKDRLVGGAGDDVLEAGSGDDEVLCDEGNDQVNAGIGNDRIVVSADVKNSRLTINGDFGTDTLLLPGKQERYAIDNDLKGLVIKDTLAGNTLYVSNVETLDFDGTAVRDTTLRRANVDYLLLDKQEKLDVLANLTGTLDSTGQNKVFGSTITYGFVTQPGYYSPSKLPPGEALAFAPFTDFLASATREMFDYLSHILGVRFEEAAFPAFAYARYQLSNMTVGGYAVSPGFGTSGWVNVDIERQTESALGGFGLSTIVHETGHVLGLDHSADYSVLASSSGAASDGDDVPYYYDRTTLSIMSYQNVRINNAYKGSFAPLDWQTLMALYGTNTQSKLSTFNIHVDASRTKAEGVLNVFDESSAEIHASAPFTLISLHPETVINLTDCKVECLIDLEKYGIWIDGTTFSSLTGAYNYLNPSTVSAPIIDIYPTTRIAEITGSLANDTLRAPFEIQRFNGNAGVDTIVLKKNPQDYRLEFGEGSVLLITDIETGKTLQLRETEILVYGDKSSRSLAPLIATGNSEDIYLTDSDDIVEAGGGIDYLWSSFGSDRIAAGAGDDDIELWQGKQDWIDGGAGVDVVHVQGKRSAFDFVRGKASGEWLLTDIASGKQSTLIGVEVVKFWDKVEIPDHTYTNLKAVNNDNYADINVLLAFNLWFGDTFKTVKGRETSVRIQDPVVGLTRDLNLKDLYSVFQYYAPGVKFHTYYERGALYLKDLDAFVDRFLVSQFADSLSNRDYATRLVKNYFNTPVPQQAQVDQVLGWLEAGTYNKRSLFKLALQHDTEELFSIDYTGMFEPFDFSYSPFYSLS